ncbi:ras-related protein Rab-3A-like [Meleagris gallopavo]|uniref:ras-related protein Rab-3A-like n=2 Tax=Neognathae TaxID=8825 RepID=UPI00093E1C1E|nr:ras-related protein Rab-3A-like [Meleagris gallopavo]
MLENLQRLTHSPATGARQQEMASVTDARYRQKDTSDQNFDYMFKLLIIGNSSVGKTSFLFRYADDTFTPAFVSTVGIDFKVKTVYRNDKRVKLQIWVSASIFNSILLLNPVKI